MTKNCKTCEKSKRIYMQDTIFTDKLREYYCTEREEMIKHTDSCGKWRKKAEEYELSVQRLKDVENDVKYLLEHLEDTGGGRYYYLIFKP